MAFAKTTWVDGSNPAITAAQLNRIEQGIADAHAGNIDADSIGTTQLANGAVTNVKLRDSAALSVIGRAINTAGAPSDITATVDGHVLRRNGGTLLFGTVATAGIADGAVTAVKLASGLNERTWVAGRLNDIGYLNVGAFALLRHASTVGTLTGATRAGSDLRYSDVDGNIYTSLTPSGTWRCHGYSGSGGQATLWLRIA